MTKKYTYGSIIPLIGGMTIAAKELFGYDPEWIASWGSAFGANDKYCLEYFNSVPYIELDTGANLPPVDIVLCLPPCAGLSGANTSTSGRNPRGCNAPSNQHMLTTSEIAMRDIKAKLVMVENAPGLYTKMGEKFARNIRVLADQYGYAMSMVKTNTIFHGLPQSRTRTFFFLWQRGEVPILKSIRRSYTQLSELLIENPILTNSPPVNKKAYRPSQMPMIEFLITNGRERKLYNTYSEMIKYYAKDKMTSVWDVIYKNDLLDEAIQWISDNKDMQNNILAQKEVKWLKYAKNKKARGLNVLNSSIKLGWEKINALTWQIMPYLAHPHRDRWLTIAEALTLMRFPTDFIKSTSITTKDSNVICQNVPVCTAKDWLEEAVAALDGDREWVKLSPGFILRQNNTDEIKTMIPNYSP